jgi:long-chain acyl-CoA synthetase
MMNRFVASAGGKGDRTLITPQSAITLDGLFRERVNLTPDALAYKEFDEAKREWRDYTWRQAYELIGRWQRALEKERLQAGDRVALMLRNCVSWVAFDQAAMGLGLVGVPLYTQDRPENIAYILKDCGAKVLLVEKIEQWNALIDANCDVPGLQRIVCVAGGAPAGDSRLVDAAAWLADSAGVKHVNRDPHSLASIIYTSGTTGKPKGVMLSHHNMLSNAYDTATQVHTRKDDLFLSFLPLSHTLERTCGYYLSILAGISVAYARAISTLAEDLVTIKPTLLISVPRIYERVNSAIKAKLAEGPASKRKLFERAVDIGWHRFERSQGRRAWSPKLLLWPILKLLVARKVLEKMGGRLREAMSGGAPLSPEIAKTFIGLGLPIVEGYGLTETSPVVCCNRVHDNLPGSVGKPIPNVQVKIGDKNALLVKGPNIMLGYWNNAEATKAMFTEDGWLNTGDTARIDSDGRIFITGRLKEIIVLSNGEKIPPADMEAAILRDPLFEQVMVLGESRPYLGALAVVKAEEWKKLTAALNVAESNLSDGNAEQTVLARVAKQIAAFPGYAQVRRIALLTEPWTIENGLLTPTLKLKRGKVLERYRGEVEKLYAGH